MKMSGTDKRKRNIALLASGAILLFGTVCEAEAQQPAAEYELDQVLVTAQRYEKRDVDIPASTSVYTSEQLEATGASNVIEALKMAAGLVYSTYGPSGASQSTMTSQITIRGAGSGTLVLVNGTPLNLRGMYNLEDIPLNNVERVEIVKGGGSVLYGSEATGGIINIITKKQVENTIQVSGGNFGQQQHSLNLQVGKVGIGYSLEKWGDLGKISTTSTQSGNMDMCFPGVDRENQMLTYRFDDKLSLMYTHNYSETSYDYKFGDGFGSHQGLSRYTRLYNDTKDFAQLQYDDKTVKGTVYFNQKKLQTTGTNYYNVNSATGAVTGDITPPAYTDKTDKLNTYGTDIQKIWQQKADKILMGLSTQHEYYSPDIAKTQEYERDIYSIYGQWEKPVDDVNTLILSGRETWTANAPNDRNYNNFSSQGQYLHKLNNNESVYVSVGQSFKMPTFSQIYSTSDSANLGNPNLKPQTGIHYEAGWKLSQDDHSWRVSVFNSSVKDNISSTYSGGMYQYTNEDFKNTGIEVTCDIKGNAGWQYNWGVSYGDPQSRSTKKPYWDRQYGRWQLNGGATYQSEKLKAAVSANYLADRVMSPSAAHSSPGRPYLLTSFNLTYSLDQSRDIFFIANNILDRNDLINHSSSDYYYTPFNFRVGFKYRF